MCYMGANCRHLANTIEPYVFGGPAEMAEPFEMPFGCGHGRAEGTIIRWG